MKENEENEIISNLEKNEIFVKGENLYPISKKCDDRCAKEYTIKNWAETFYHLKEGKSKIRYIELMMKSEHSKFFEGLNYEYGINNYPQDLSKAFNIYNNAANFSMDTMCMYRMYHIYKNDFTKFNILKRNRVLEKFYLFKCYSFLRFPQIEREEELCNRFDIPLETLIHFYEEDNNFTIFERFIKFLNENYELYNINKEDLLLIEPIIVYKISKDETKRQKSIKDLNDLSKNNNLEALYKLTCFTKNNNEEEKENIFKLLYNKKYYRSYIDYAIYLYSNERYKESLDVLKIAKENGIIPAGYIYYDIYLETNDLSLIMKEAKISSIFKECELYNLLELLIDDILNGKIYSFFEFIFLRKISIKHFKLENEINQYFNDFTKEMINFLVKITDGPNNNIKKEKINEYFFKTVDYQELHLACGTLYFYGINNLIEKDISKSLQKFNIANEESNSDSYKRFVFYFIFRVVKKLFEEQLVNNSIENLISDKMMKDFEKKIFSLFHSSLDGDISQLSSSFFYFLSRLLHKKIGNNGNKLLELICLKKSTEYSNKNPGTGSIINIYRKYKTKFLMEKYEDDFNKELNSIQKNKDSEGYGEDGSICPICFENKRNILSLPCKHLFCDFCIDKIEKCPICRRPILMKHKLD